MSDFQWVLVGTVIFVVFLAAVFIGTSTGVGVGGLFG